MKIEIHDVGHGACAVVTCPNGARIKLDCGLNLEKSWFPSVVFSRQYFDLLVAQNLDRDHLEDLPYCLKSIRYGSFFSNPTITAQALGLMKAKYGMHESISAVQRILDQYNPGFVGKLAPLGEVAVWAWWNRLGVDFIDTNNLSIVTFIRWGTFTILFSGDLETKGWQALLRHPRFQADLATVSVIVASHHGRANGQCEEVFKIARPEVAVFSDDKKKFETQETDAWYRSRVRGIPLLNAPMASGGTSPMRHVLTTRRDGTITISVYPTGRYIVSTTTPRQPTLGEILLGQRRVA